MATQREIGQLEEELKAVKAELQELKTKLDVSGNTEIGDASAERLGKVGAAAAEVVTSATEVLEQAAKIVQAAALGAYEGAKKALHEAKDTPADEASSETDKPNRDVK